MWRGGVGAAYRLPALSSAGASLASPCFRFHPAHRTGWADFPLPALGERFTMSPTRDGADIFVRDAVEHGAAFVLPRSCNYKSISVLLASWAPQDNSKIVV
jgi:hypothetical protein